jgi:tRNA dimethylallyltransferase
VLLPVRATGRASPSRPDRDPALSVRHLALVGPTASGKSSVAVALAQRLGDVEIVTVDSMQVYRGMDIGTAKPTPAERCGVRHHLIDLADPGEEWTVTRWLEAAARALAGIEERGRRALLVGGTGLYFQALVDNLRPPARYPAAAAALEAEPDTAVLHGRLRLLDPTAATRIDPANRRRVVRALEVTIGSGKPFSASGPGVGAHPPTPWRLAGLWLPRPVVAERIARRFTTMLEAGLVAETAQLAARPGGLSPTARQALGYREVLAHLEADRPLAAAADEAVRRTRALARRQRMWWRRDHRVSWFGTADNPLAVVPALLGEWRTR